MTKIAIICLLFIITLVGFYLSGYVNYLLYKLFYNFEEYNKGSYIVKYIPKKKWLCMGESKYEMLGPDPFKFYYYYNNLLDSKLENRIFTFKCKHKTTILSANNTILPFMMRNGPEKGKCISISARITLLKSGDIYFPDYNAFLEFDFKNNLLVMCKYPKHNWEIIKI